MTYNVRLFIFVMDYRAVSHEVQDSSLTLLRTRVPGFFYVTVFFHPSGWPRTYVKVEDDTELARWG